MTKFLEVIAIAYADRISRNKIDSIAVSHNDGAEAGYNAVHNTFMTECENNPETPSGQLAQTIVDNL